MRRQFISRLLRAEAVVNINFLFCFLLDTSYTPKYPNRITTVISFWNLLLVGLLCFHSSLMSRDRGRLDGYFQLCGRVDVMSTHMVAVH